MSAFASSDRAATHGCAPIWFNAAAFGGVAWNLFGLVQFAGSLAATPESLMASGLTAQQASVMSGYPAWMTLAFGLGVLGGIAGSVLLVLRHGSARAVLAVSLAAYVLLWIGDLVHGVFAVMGLSQLIILTIVVVIAALLLALSYASAARR